MSVNRRNPFVFLLSSKAEHHRLLYIALPMILSNITNPLLGMVDTAIIGHLDGTFFLAGTAVATMVITQIYWVCGFLRMSATGLSAQARGERDTTAGSRVFYQLLMPAVLIGVLMILFQGVLIQIAGYFAEASIRVNEVIGAYIGIRVWGAPAALANLMLVGWLVGQQHTRLVMLIQILGNLLNAILSLFLAIGLGWGVEGVAAATVVAEYAIFIASFYVVMRNTGWRGPRFEWFRLQIYRQVLDLNRDIFLRNLALQVTIAFLTFQGARLGEDIVAVNALLMQFFVITALGLDGIAYGVEALVGESKGAGARQQLHDRVRVGLFWSALLAVVYSLFFILFDSVIIALLTDLAPLRQLATAFLPYIWVMPLLAHWCFLMDGVFIGLTRGKAMRNSMLFCTLAVFFPLWWLTSALGNHALWLAFLGFLLARGVSLGWLYLRLFRQQALL
ncbi:MATE family efflux transporter [Lacimicrobium alkaliphilum]|uniref:MATE family efflux transporter n=1 Tax=Lacimicrobium alkaliphilum TaxID=1526571 RepID=A0ABQ1RS43_9ALTE|nr:MATE family efflux transporter [Lacimicrobium alkaliphilum]